MQQQDAQASLSRQAYLILASLVQGPKHAIALWEAIERTEGLYIEPGTLCRVLTQLERCGWIEAVTTEQSLQLYHHSDREAEGATEPSHNSLSPRVWIIITPVLFLVFCVEIEYIGLPDYPGLGEVFFVWLLTGLASLIILLLLKLASRAGAVLPPDEMMQQTQVQA